MIPKKSNHQETVGLCKVSVVLTKLIKKLCGTKNANQLSKSNDY